MNAHRLLVASGALLASEGTVSAQTTTRVSVSSSGTQSNNNSAFTNVSGDGNAAAFASWATNLVSGDTNGWVDVFVNDRATGVTERVSVDSSGTESNGDSRAPSLSADGRLVAFVSAATNLIAKDVNGRYDIFVHDRNSGVTECVSVDSAGVQSNGQSFDPPSISSDGTLVAFPSYGSNLVPGDTNIHADVFVHDRTSGNTERVSVDSSGNQQDGNSTVCAISSDGSVVAFESDATNLVSGDTNKLQDVFVHDRATGTTERISVDSSGSQGNGKSWSPAASSDGHLIAFWSDATNLVASDTNACADVFVRDRVAGTTIRVSVDSSGAQANGPSSAPSMSSDGRFIVFTSTATNLVAGDTNGNYDVFSHDTTTGTTLRVSVDSSGNQASGDSAEPSVSADGQVIGFDSTASNLVAHDTNGFDDIFVHDVFDATWANYGSGFAGTNGVPAFTSRSPPRIGTAVTLDLVSSFGAPTSGVLFLGFQRGSFHSSLGGDLLLVPTLANPIALDAVGASITGTLPSDPSLIGIAIDLQVLELDPGAAKGVSFTAGLELVLGH